MHAITRTETSARLNVIPTPRADATLQTGGELEGGEHRRPGTGSRDRLRSAAWAVVSGRLGLALAIAALLGVLEAWATRGDGYTAGWGDHFVL
jgi:hypothetical protein